jgi:hypothetical protein
MNPKTIDALNSIKKSVALNLNGATIFFHVYNDIRQDFSLRIDNVMDGVPNHGVFLNDQWDFVNALKENSGKDL